MIQVNVLMYDYLLEKLALFWKRVPTVEFQPCTVSRKPALFIGTSGQEIGFAVSKDETVLV